ACFKKPDTAYQQEFCGADDARGHAAPESHARRPESDAYPEGIARPPIEYVDTERRDHECDRERHHHYMYRVPDQRNRRTNIQSKQIQRDRSVRLGREIVPLHHRSPPPRWKQRRSNAHCSLLSLTVQLGMLATLPGCTGPLSTLDPAGPAGASIASLWWVMLAGSAVLFALVMTLFVLAIQRPGWGASVSPGRWLVLGGLAAPAVILLPLIAQALVTGERLLPLPGHAPMRIEAIGQQWNWTFRYPDHGGVETKNVLHIPAGTPIDILVSSQDVIHAFW